MREAGSNPNWLQLVLGGSIGVLLTFFLARGLDLARNRPNLEVRLQETRERLYVTDEGSGGSPRFIVCDPWDDRAQLVITLDLLCVNHSYQRDGLVSAKLSFKTFLDEIPGRVRADEAFLGMNVDGHSIEHVRLRFFLQRQSQGATRGYNDVPLWSEEPLPDMALAISTVRQRGQSRIWPILPNKSTHTLDVDGATLRRTHREGVGILEIHYLSKPPPTGQPPVTSSALRQLRKRLSSWRTPTKRR
jgi:hypothetical protein